MTIQNEDGDDYGDTKYNTVQYNTNEEGDD